MGLATMMDLLYIHLSVSGSYVFIMKQQSLLEVLPHQDYLKDEDLLPASKLALKYHKIWDSSNSQMIHA